MKNTDPCLELLSKHSLQFTPNNTLCILPDGATVEQFSFLPKATFLTQRYDVYQDFIAAKKHCLISDLDIQAIEEKFQIVCLRVPKEKAVTHWLINQALIKLETGGKLILTGLRTDGIKSYIDNSKKCFGITPEVITSKTGARLAIFTKESTPENFLDDQNYTWFQTVKKQGLNFVSKPGIFGWQQIDKGSALLVETLDSETVKDKTVLDLGCGYGYLSIKASKLKPSSITATDNNATAVGACKKNFAMHGINGEVILDNCADSIKEKFDLILCNPPFHKNFATDSSLTDKFINSLHRHLKSDGELRVVVNAFIPFDKKASKLFSQISCIKDTPQFKVFSLRK